LDEYAAREVIVGQDSSPAAGLQTRHERGVDACPTLPGFAVQLLDRKELRHMATEKKTGKAGEKYGVNVELKRELSKEEADFLAKTLEMTASALRLHLKDDAAVEKPNKPKPPR